MKRPHWTTNLRAAAAHGIRYTDEDELTAEQQALCIQARALRAGTRGDMAIVATLIEMERYPAMREELQKLLAEMAL